MSEAARYLLDANVLVALATRDHVHHGLVKTWFYAEPDLRWAVCAFTEAGFPRNATAPRSGPITIGEATAVLKQFAQHPGYRYQPIMAIGMRSASRIKLLAWPPCFTGELVEFGLDIGSELHFHGSSQGEAGWESFLEGYFGTFVWGTVFHLCSCATNNILEMSS